jgi:hypothetical protein
MGEYDIGSLRLNPNNRTAKEFKYRNKAEVIVALWAMGSTLAERTALIHWLIGEPKENRDFSAIIQEFKRKKIHKLAAAVQDLADGKPLEGDALAEYEAIVDKVDHYLATP